MRIEDLKGKRILMHALVNLGDVVLATSTAALLKKLCPSVHITMMVRHYAREIVVNNPVIDDFSTVRGKTKEESCRGRDSVCPLTRCVVLSAPPPICRCFRNLSRFDSLPFGRCSKRPQTMTPASALCSRFVPPLPIVRGYALSLHATNHSVISDYSNFAFSSD